MTSYRHLVISRMFCSYGPTTFCYRFVTFTALFDRIYFSDVPVEDIRPLARQELRDLLDVLVAATRQALSGDSAVNIYENEQDSHQIRTMMMFSSSGSVFASSRPRQTAWEDSSAVYAP